MYISIGWASETEIENCKKVNESKFVKLKRKPEKEQTKPQPEVKAGRRKTKKH